MTRNLILTAVLLLVLSINFVYADSLAIDSIGSLFGAPIASRVGDIVTINIIEATTNTLKVDGQMQKTTTTTVPNLLLENPATWAGMLINQLFGSGTTNTYKNSHQTNLSQKLTSAITATVIEVQPNGNLIIQGTKTLNINNEAQVVTITGIIRQFDITTLNTVNSTQVANAKIVCDGLGSDSNKAKSQGILQQIFRLFFY